MEAAIENSITENESEKSRSPLMAGNKMAEVASMLVAAEPRISHELKITEVEGGKECAPEKDPLESEVLDLGNDSEDLILVKELESPLNNSANNTNTHNSSNANTNTNAIENGNEKENEEENENGHISDAKSNSSYHGADPMGLLQRLDRNSMPGLEEDDDDDSDADDSSNGSNPGRRTNPALRWQSWMKRWEWILHEDSDGDYAFCLYCNIPINGSNKSKYIQQHNMSLYHQERENNYIAFKKSEEQTRGETSVNEVKHEFGTNSYVAAMKQKRASEVELLNNFNWQRWIQEHPWLKRVQSEGTIGECKYCNIRMNVEFVYLRKRHEAGKGHRVAERACNQADNSVGERENTPPSSGNESDSTSDTEVGDHVTNKKKWLEMIPDTTPQQCRCKACHISMFYTSFRRHINCGAHRSAVLSLDLPNKASPWAQYAEKHPWLISDPEDDNYAYCKVCEKRLIYGHSEIKRRQHENSSNHTAAAGLKKTVAEVPQAAPAEPQFEQEEEEEEPAEAQEESESTSAQNDEEETTSTHDETESLAKKRVGRKRMQYSWLRRTKQGVAACKICRLTMHERNLGRHQKSSKHQKLALHFKMRQMTLKRLNKLENLQSVSQGVESLPSPSPSAKGADQKPVPPSMHGKVLIWRTHFPWLSYKRAENRPNYGWCKLCETSVYISSSKLASKHQRSSRHVRLRNERRRMERRALAGAPPAAPAAIPVPAPISGEAKAKQAMAELQEKYDWLEPEPNDENFCHCKICDQRLPIKLFYLRQHDNSRKHADAVERHRNASEMNTEPPNVTEPAVIVQERAPQEDRDQESEVEVLSAKSESTEYEPPLKRQRRSVDARQIWRALRNSLGKRQEERSQMDLAKDLICSSFDIVTRLRSLERQPTEMTTNCQSLDTTMRSPAVASQSRDTIELFFESITQTMKALPVDLAAEGKAKIMQIICDLEVRSLHRTSLSGNTSLTQLQQPPSQNSPQKRQSQFTTPQNTATAANQSKISNNLAIEDLSLSSNSSTSTNMEDLTTVTIDDDDDDNEPADPPTSTSNITPEVSITTVPRRHSMANLNSTNGQAQNRHSKEGPSNSTLRNILSVPSQKQNDSVRCVPINQLTGSGHPSTSTPIVKALHPGKSLPNGAGNGPGNGVTSVRKIRVMNGSETKLITIPSTTTIQQRPATQGLTSAQLQAQAQLQSLNFNRPNIMRKGGTSSGGAVTGHGNRSLN